LLDCFVWISETIWGGMVFYQVFLLSKSQVQAVEIPKEKPKVGVKFAGIGDWDVHERKF
jgi:hypothetical protein